MTARAKSPPPGGLSDGARPQSVGPSHLRSAGRPLLESLFTHAQPFESPRGVYRGEMLTRLDGPEARRLRWRAIDKIGFEWLPFGVDFERRLWFFGPRWLAAGRFEPRVADSRWRSTRVVALHYDVSRLPRPVRGILYDEVKPLSATVLLGIGGIDAPPGRGEHFFFMLERIDG